MVDETIDHFMISLIPRLSGWNLISNPLITVSYCGLHEHLISSKELLLVHGNKDQMFSEHRVLFAFYTCLWNEGLEPIAAVGGGSK